MVAMLLNPPRKRRGKKGKSRGRRRHYRKASRSKLISRYRGLLGAKRYYGGYASGVYDKRISRLRKTLTKRGRKSKCAGAVAKVLGNLRSKFNITPKSTRWSYKRVGDNPVRRRRSKRRKSRNYSRWFPAEACNGRRRRRSKRRKSRNCCGGSASWVPDYAKNPGKLIGKVRNTFRFNTIKDAAPLAVGLGVNPWIESKLSPWIAQIPVIGNYLGGDAGSVGSLVVGLLSATAQGIVAGMIPGVNKYAGKLATGGIVGSLARFGISKAQSFKEFGFSGLLGDYLTPFNAASALPLGYSNFGELGGGFDEFGDYLTPQGAASALPLG